MKNRYQKILIMSFIQSMQNRYTTKKYDASKKIDGQKIEELQQILQLSPSSINSQPWKFTFVSDEGKKQQLSEASFHNKDKVLDCDTVIVMSRIDNIRLFEEQIERELAKGAVDYYKKFIQPLSDDKIKSWFDKQVYLALGVLLSACAEMGIDATPMEGIEPEKYDQVLGQEDYSTSVAVTIGYRDQKDFNQPSNNPKSRRDISKVVELI